ncbi:MAG TPA: hypothetical protein VNA20_10250 [Frankiaceae bacterium]|nr:hypothetical protein [Frankiaceae bacterium]
MSEEYTSRTSRAFFAFQGGLYGGFAGAGLMGLVDGTPLLYPGYAVLAALVTAGVWRGATVKVTADTKRLVVRNVFATYVVRWADVRRIGERALIEYPAQSRPCPALYVRGRRRPIKLVAMTVWGFRSDERIVRALRRWQQRTGS